MKKKNLTRKLITSIATAAMTAVCLTTTTYAWFSRNDNVWTDETSFNVISYDGLLISTDGINFSQDISEAQMKTLIAGSEENYDNLRFDGVTPKQDDNGKLVFDGDGKAKFEYDTVRYNDTNGYYHEMKDAVANQYSVIAYNDDEVIVDSANSYIQFDLYFRIASGGTNQKNSFNLFFVDEAQTENANGIKENVGYTKITSKEKANVKLTTDLTTCGSSVVTAGTYHANDEITFDIVNAVRLGTSTYDGDSTEMTIYEVTNEYDLGSVAITESQEEKNDPSKNAMYTYYNNVFRKYPFTSAATAGEAYETKDSFEDNTLGTFTYDESLYEQEGHYYNDVKVSFYIWLEGWDADYLYGASDLATLVSFSLAFGYGE